MAEAAVAKAADKILKARGAWPERVEA